MRGAREERKTTMAAQLCTESNGGDDNDGADVLPLCLLQDLLGVVSFLASHPLHAAYVLFFSRYLISLAAFFCPLLVSTSLLLVVLVTAAPYVSPEWTGVYSLGRTCGIAVDALCAEVRPDSAGVGLVGQICSFVLGSADGACVLRVGEIMSELCDITCTCFLLEEKSLLLGTEEWCKLGIELPLQTLIGEKIFLDHDKFGQIQGEIEDTIVVREDFKEFKGSGSSSEHSCPSVAFVQEMEEEEDGVRDGIDAKSLDCDPVSVEIKKCELVNSCSSVSGRIRQWEAQLCDNLIQLPEETADNPLEFSLEKRSLNGMKESTQLETKARDKKCSKNLQAPEIPIVEESVQVQQQQGQEFKDVKQSDTKTSSEKCSEDHQPEELSASIVQPQQECKERSQDVQAEPELQEQEYKDVQPGQESQEQSHKDVQVEQDPREQENKYMEPEEELQDQKDRDAQPDPNLHGQEYKDAGTESESLCDDASDDSLKSTLISRRVHSRTSSENLVSEGSPQKERKWKRTLACKLYEERMKLKVCRDDRAVVGCNDDMDMLWAAYEVGCDGDKAKRANMQEDFVEEGKIEEGEEDEDEGSVRQLCCLQALKFSTRKMNFAGGKPSLAKISKVLRRITALSRVRSWRNLEV